jgi:hypothetical protein
MKNLSHSKELLNRALSSLPDENALADVRMAVRRAVQRLEEVERKRGKRQNEHMPPAEKWKFDLETSALVPPMSPVQAKNALREIDRMIGEEEQKLKGKNEQDVGTILD